MVMQSKQRRNARLNYPMHDLSKGTTVVTGGAGFIGSAVIWGINLLNLDNVWLVDETKVGENKKRNFEKLKFKRIIGVQSFRDLVELNDPELAKVNTIIHLGACSSTTETDENYLHDNNYLYTKELCEWSLKKGVRFLYASSAATYGDGLMGMDDQEENIEKFKPLNAYGWSKHNFDLLAKERDWLSRIVGLKFFNVYGPNEEHKGKMRSVVSKAYKQIIQRGEMTLFKSQNPKYADGLQMRDFLYVKDAVRMTLWLAKENMHNGLFNLGSGNARSWLDLGNSLFSALYKDSNIRFVEMPDELKHKYQYFTEAKVEKIHNAGFDENLFSLEEGVNDYVKNYLSTNLNLGA